MTSDLSTPDACVESAGEITFVERTVDHPDAAHLLDAFYKEQFGRYGFAESVDLEHDDYAVPNGIFIVAYRRDLPVGCGGYRWYDRKTATVEIKKTYLLPVARGRGVGHALLRFLESTAIKSGARRAILETGVRNTAALSLFISSGYEPTARYVSGRDPLINRAFAKALASSPRLHGRAAQATA
ncbi:GNAT family N-acetyltransferase [Dactylosporangium darangshiense]|uniref:GNAT family N-acetyltransferase n=1 Tax=Dactylosporangium darangshiense TaxID=579108 RepID=A0ABP8CTC7_9ACTN